MTSTFSAKIHAAQRVALVLAGIGIAGCIIGAVINAPQFFASYLFGFLWWLGLSLGCFAVAMIHYLTGGRWGDPVRRFLEGGYMTLPVMALLFIPILFGLKFLYPWNRPEVVAANPIVASQHAYMNTTAFIIRACFFFGVWIVMATRLRKWSLQQDETTDVAPTRRLRALSGPGIVIYTLTSTFAFIDWINSLEPDWHSTMAPLIICIGQILSAYAFVIILLASVKKRQPWSAMNLTTSFHHLGNLLLAFVMFWTYISFGQLLIVWSGNLPSEIGWYQHRIAGNWKAIVVFLAVFNFFLPFFLLLFRASKRHSERLVWIAIAVLFSQVVNTFWLIAPAFNEAGIHVSWMDFAALFGIGGIWLAIFCTALKRATLLARNDPQMDFLIRQEYEPTFSK